MDHGGSSRGPRVGGEQEVDGPPASRRWVEERTFTVSGRRLNADGISTAGRGWAQLVVRRSPAGQ